jgi:hypothetical protein
MKEKLISLATACDKLKAHDIDAGLVDLRHTVQESRAVYDPIIDKIVSFIDNLAYDEASKILRGWASVYE